MTDKTEIKALTIRVVYINQIDKPTVYKDVARFHRHGVTYDEPPMEWTIIFIDGRETKIRYDLVLRIETLPIVQHCIYSEILDHIESDNE